MRAQTSLSRLYPLFQVFRAALFPAALSLLAAPVISVPSQASAQNLIENTLGACYAFKFQDSAEMAAAAVEHEEIWCYKKLTEPSGSTYIFNVEDSQTHPELAAIVYPDGSLVHGSLLNGEVTVHKILPAGGGFNPLPVPLTPEPTTQRVTMPPSANLERSAADTLRFLLTEKAEPADLTLEESDASILVSAETRPWRGYWWPYRSGRLWRGSSSPLAKYEQFVKAQSGARPRAIAWEKRNHPLSGGKWDGHCNGWAASSILAREPQNSVKDSRSGVRFSISDLKGLLAARYSCTKYSFYGTRYNGRRDDPRDISPAEFHKVITYNIGKLKKPVIMDRMASTPVDNHVVSGYTTNIKRLGGGRLSVTTTLTVHGYDKKPSDLPGTAKSYQKTYKYVLSEGRDGEILSGVWRSPNPDFLWVPLRATKCKEGDGNPEVTDEWLDEILDLR